MTENERIAFEELRRAASIVTKHGGRPISDPRVLAALPNCVKACNRAERILNPLRSSQEILFVESDRYDDPSIKSPWLVDTPNGGE